MWTEYKKTVAGTVIGSLSTVVVFLLTSGWLNKVKEVHVDTDVKIVFGQGWVPNPDAVKLVVATLEFPRFGDTPAGQLDVGILPQSVFLWDAYVKKFGKLPWCHNQGQVGSCVSFGTSRALEATFINAIVHDGAPYEFADIFEEVIYAGSRVDVGQNQLGNEDGSVGAWAAKYVSQIGGSLPRGIYGATDGTTYNEARARSWGNSGVPASLVAESKKYRSGSVSQVRTWDEAKKALAQRYGIAVCSNQGFTMQRNSNGVCEASGTWGHCMCLDGYYIDTDGREYGHIQNSWGANAMTGPVGWGTPNTGGFWATSRALDGMLRQGDSWAYSAVKGFPAKNVSWVQNVVPKKNIFDKELALAW